MEEAGKPSNSESYTPSSELFRIYRMFSFPHSVQTGCRAYIVSYLVDTAGSFPQE
jgi:hypothetical protein